MVGLNLMKLGLTESQLNSYLEPFVHHRTKLIPQIRYCSHVNGHRVERKGQSTLQQEGANYHINIMGQTLSELSNVRLASY